MFARRLGDDERALQLWQESGLAYGPYYAGHYFRKSGNWMSAERELAIAAESQPENALTHYYLCVVRSALRHLNEATVSCERAVALASDNPTFRLLLADVLAEQGALDRALAEAQVAVSLTRSPKAYLFLGRLQLKSDTLVNAEQSLQRSIELEPTADAYYWLGVVLQRKGNLPDAQAAWRLALALDPNYAPALEALR